MPASHRRKNRPHGALRAHKLKRRRTRRPKAKMFMGKLVSRRQAKRLKSKRAKGRLVMV